MNDGVVYDLLAAACALPSGAQTRDNSHQYHNIDAIESWTSSLALSNIMSQVIIFANSVPVPLRSQLVKEDSLIPNSRYLDHIILTVREI